MSNRVEEIKAFEEADEAYDTSDPEAVNKQRKKTARTRADRLHFVEAAMSTEQGRAWFYDILEFCRVFRVAYTNGDVNDTLFKLGAQNVGLRILSDLQEAAPQEYLTMIKENK